MRRATLIVLLLMIVLDVAGNLLCTWGSMFYRTAQALWRARGSTLSATAWAVREHPVFGWTHRFIDGMPWFGAGHCRAQFEREQHFGGVWAAWSNQFNKE
jgi:hypothetical protein